MIPRNISHHMTEMPHTISDAATVHKARSMMDEFGYHHLPVLHGGHLVGMVSEGDLRWVETLKKEDDTLISEIMNHEPFTVERTADIKDVLAAMQSKGYSSAIVKGSEHEPWGIFTITDAVRLLMATI